MNINLWIIGLLILIIIFVIYFDIIQYKKLRYLPLLNRKHFEKGNNKIKTLTKLNKISNNIDYKCSVKQDDNIYMKV